MTPRTVGWILGGSAAAVGVLGVAVAVRGRRSGGFGAMNRIGAAVTLFDHQPPKISELRELVLRAGVSGVLDEHSPLSDHKVLPLLIRAYNSALIVAAEEGGKPEPQFVTKAGAEGVWRTHATRGYRAFFPDAPEGDEAIPWWPEILPFEDDYTQGLVADLGYLFGYIEGRTFKNVQEHVRKQMEAEGR
jgi:hypothetical protein